MQKVLEKVRNEPFFKWPNKMPVQKVLEKVRNEPFFMDTLLKIAEICGIIWNNWSEKGN